MSVAVVEAAVAAAVGAAGRRGGQEHVDVWQCEVP